jgi:hypothetical protein
MASSVHELLGLMTSQELATVPLSSKAIQRLASNQYRDLASGND